MEFLGDRNSLPFRFDPANVIYDEGDHHGYYVPDLLGYVYSHHALVFECQASNVACRILLRLESRRIHDVKIILKEEKQLSSWVRLVTKTVNMSEKRPREIFHSLIQADYITILACTRSGLIPIVRQYRPAVETYTWELPAGLVEHNETPEMACRRELQEETGLVVESIVDIGTYYADTGRLENRIYAFFAATSEPDPGFIPESGMTIEFVSLKTLKEYILTGKFQHALHLGILAVAQIYGVITGGFHEIQGDNFAEHANPAPGLL